MLSELQKKTAEAIVNIFETGSAVGDYANVTVVAGDPGHLTYGRSQTTLASGNLFLLLRAYVDAPDAQFADGLRPFLARVQARDLSLDNDMTLRGLLQRAGGDPVMRAEQDAFFDRVYWEPARRQAEAIGVGSALGYGVVYDSTVHGSWRAMRDRTNAAIGALPAVGEQAWIAKYVAVRRDWLANNTAVPLLRKTVYRMDAFNQVISANNWDLALPLTVRGITLTEALLSGAPMRVSAHVVEERTLMVTAPMMQGEDVRAVQQALKAKGAALDADGVFGNDTAAAVSAFQAAQGLKADGIVGPATRAALGL
jgi:chitosanase